MNKLKLEHLAPYLPYGLKVRHELKEKFNTLIVMGIHDDGGRVRYENEKDVSPKFSLAVCWKERHKYESTKYFYIQDNFKPILRPLSYLTKEIEHNGERFVPVDRLEWNSYDHIIKKGMCDNVGYQYMIKLFEWHFDVFGLIDKGLAIDINTLNEKND